MRQVKKEYNVGTTDLQTRAFKNLSDKHRYKFKGEALLAAGYSKSMAEQPCRVFSRKGFLQIVDKYLPAELVVERHRQLLDKEEIVFTKDGWEKTGQPHSDVKGALNLRYKLKGDYAPEQKEETIKTLNIKIDLSRLTAEQLTRFAQTGNYDR